MESLCCGSLDQLSDWMAVIITKAMVHRKAASKKDMTATYRHAR